jgi:preprotein translocase subunit YajC
VDNLLSILPLVGIAVLFWLILIRPAQRRQRSLATLQGQVSVGDEVMLTSGIYGTVRGLDDQTLSLEVAEGVTLKVVRAAVGSVETSPTAVVDDDAELVLDESEEK